MTAFDTVAHDLVVRSLVKLGFSQTEIRRAIGCSASIPFLAAWRAAKAETPEVPTAPEKLYQARIEAYAALDIKPCSDAEKLVRRYLRDRMSIGDHVRYLNTLLDMAEHMSQLCAPPEAKGYANLLRSLRRGWHYLNDSSYWHDLVARGTFLADGSGSVRKDMLEFVDRNYRGSFLPPWPENGVAVLNRLLESFTDHDTRKKEILQYRFGLLGEPESLEAVGVRFGISKERIRQLEAKGLLKLSQGWRRRIIDTVFFRTLEELAPPLSESGIDELFKRLQPAPLAQE